MASRASASGWAISATSWSTATANALMSDFVARKIRQRVKNPAVAEKLIPRNHGFGTRRLPLETRYYEVYNQPNVELVDLLETPIERSPRAGSAHRRASSSST
jgi:cation diffusion facilitator CzcD-associated flavoprotein CzcO